MPFIITVRIQPTPLFGVKRRLFMLGKQTHRLHLHKLQKIKVHACQCALPNASLDVRSFIWNVKCCVHGRQR